MFDYLQKFNSLPKDLRDQVSSASAMETLGALENKYKVDLAMIVMKVMIKSLFVQNLPVYFVGEFALSAEQAKSLAEEMKEKIFSRVADYLQLDVSTRAWDFDKGVDLLVKETGLILPAENLLVRFKTIISTYLKGIRSKIDTRASLAKGVKIGGLDLSEMEIDRIFKVCEQEKYKNLAHLASSVAVPSKPSAPATRLNKIIAAAEVSGPNAKTGEYDLKQAINSGQIKKPIILDPKHELPSPEKELDLPLPNISLKPAAPNVSRQFAPPAPSSVASNRPVPPRSVPPKIPSQPIRTSVAPNRPAPVPSNTRPQMHDIRPMPKVMGPLEELQFLDVVNFRRLGKTPAERTAKIFAKIKLLEEGGYDKMVLGVRAWRQSLVNRLYLALIREAINKDRPLQEELAARQKENPESLSWEEVQAIIALNSKLVF